MMHRVNYNGFEMESESAWEWRAIDKRVSFEADYLNTQINANRVDMGSVHVTPAMAMAEIEDLEWITKMPEEDSGDVLFGAEVKAYDPNQKRGEAGTPDCGRWVKEDGGSNDLKRFSSYDDLYRGLNNDLVDQGKYGAVFDVGVDGFLLKASSDDPAYEKYIKFIEENKPESSLYPKVKESWNLEDGSFSTLVERVTPALKRADAYQIEDMLDIMAMGEDLPENYKILAESLGFTENDYSAFLDTIKDMGGDDIHVGNIGFRDNGELVIFDPVKPSNAKP